MNVIAITEFLSVHPDSVCEILEDIGFSNIKFDAVKRQFRFARGEGNNPTSILMNLDTLKFFCFSTNDKGNLYTLVMEKQGMSFPECLRYIAKKAGIQPSSAVSNIKLPFGGFFKNLQREIMEPECSLQTYSTSILKDFSDMPNMLFYNDGIGFDVQSEFNIGYDIVTNRITVPIWTFKGELCGIMGRLNDKECAHEDRWLPIIPCSRSLTLFGFHRNYQTIQEKGLCIICESEKAPMQAASFGCNCVLGASGCHISQTQAKYIKSLMTDRIIVAFDEGLDEEFVRNEAQKLVCNNSILKNKVGYIWDGDNEILEKNKKQSITDLGKDKFAYAIHKKVKWL